jgi:nucleoside-diphosphate-sugar epimerase
LEEQEKGMARVLVTGATGFIGRHLVRHLVQRGDHVRCLIHYKEQDIAGVECVRADITAPHTLNRVVMGADIVYHLAGATLVVSPHRYKTINGLGTRNLGHACAILSNPPVLVYLSSLAAAGPSFPGKPRREEDQPTPVSEYGRSKLMGERFLRRYAGHLPVTVVRPPGVFGPGDPNLLMLFKSTHWGVNFIPGTLDQQLALIYVDDLVAALPQAAERGERLLDHHAGPNDPRGIYFVALDEHRTLVEIGQLTRAAVGETRGAGHPVPGVRAIAMPYLFTQVLARVNDFLARLTMRPMLLTSDKLREARAGSWICSSEKARRGWGFACRTNLADGLQRTAQWYRRRKWL